MPSTGAPRPVATLSCLVALPRTMHCDSCPTASGLRIRRILPPSLYLIDDNNRLNRVVSPYPISGLDLRDDAGRRPTATFWPKAIKSSSNGSASSSAPLGPGYARHFSPLITLRTHVQWQARFLRAQNTFQRDDRMRSAPRVRSACAASTTSTPSPSSSATLRH